MGNQKLVLVSKSVGQPQQKCQRRATLQSMANPAVGNILGWSANFDIVVNVPNQEDHPPPHVPHPCMVNVADNSSTNQKYWPM